MAAADSVSSDEQKLSLAQLTLQPNVLLATHQSFMKYTVRLPMSSDI